MASVEEIAQNSIDETESIEAGFVREEESAMNKYYVLLAAYILAIDRMNPPNPAQIKDDLTDLTIEAGIVGLYEKMITGYQTILDSQYATIDGMVSGEATLAEEGLASITAKAETDLMANMANLDVMIADQTAAVSNYALGIVDDIDDDIKSAIDTLSNKNKSAITTDIFSTARLAAATVAIAYDLKKFLYAGPRDERNRPFCAEHVHKIYGKAEIDSMDNGMLNPVFIYGGGYNCRHVWQAVGL